MGVWIGLELNMFSFLPLLLKGGKSALLYFIVQALGTVFLLIGFIKPNFGFFLLLGLGLKLGLIPLYIWVLAIVKEIRWDKVWLILIVQKFHLLLLLTYVPAQGARGLLFLVLFTCLIVGLHLLLLLLGFIGKRRKKPKEILALASILDSCLLIWLFQVKRGFALVYFGVYGFLLFCLCKTWQQGFKNRVGACKFILVLANIRGFPPFISFFMKAGLLYRFRELFYEIGKTKAGDLTMWGIPMGLWRAMERGELWISPSLLFLVLFPVVVQFLCYLFLLLKYFPRFPWGLKVTRRDISIFLGLIGLKGLWWFLSQNSLNKIQSCGFWEKLCFFV